MNSKKKGASHSKKKAPHDKNDWRSRIISGKMPHQAKDILKIMGTPVMKAGDYTIIGGQMKTRKTLLSVYLMSEIKGNLLVFDTEQSPYHVWLLKKRIDKLKVDKAKVTVIFLRGLSVGEKVEFIRNAINDNPDVCAVMIDNLRDLLQNINDPIQSQGVIELLEAITFKFNISILGVIHFNPGTKKARGHLGTELQNKSFMMIETSNNRIINTTSIKCLCSRDESFTPFTLKHNEKTGMPEVIFPDISNEQKQNVLREGLGGMSLSLGILVTSIRKKLANGSELWPERKAKALIKIGIEKKWIQHSGKPNTKSSKYSWIGSK